MATATVRIRAETQAKLRELAKESGQSVPDVLEAAIEAYRRRLFLEGLATDFEVLRSNSQNWAEELQERAAWDSTLADDLEAD